MWNHIRFIRCIKERIPFGLKMLLIKILVCVQSIWYLYVFKHRFNYSNDKKIFLLLSTDYSNLGDHAMTYAHIKLLKENFPDYEVIEILVGDTLKCLWSIKQSINKEDIITLKGGGNVGMEYFREELIRRKILKYFPNNKIVMFPQTVSFPKNRIGEREFNNTIKIFNDHTDFHAFFRDKTSYDMMKPYLKQNVYITPDIVLSLGTINVNFDDKQGAVTCLRRDVEGIYTDKDKELVYRVLKEKYNNKLLITDTIKEYQILTCDRMNELKKMWKTIAEAELVVTDRLHGMIFAALLGTPCIVLNTYNHKLRGQYEWLSDLNYMYCIELDESVLRSTIEKIKTTEVQKMDASKFKNYYNIIINVINGGQR